MPKTTIAVAGATGFVGQALIPALAKKHDVIALSRSPRQSESSDVTYRACNLFNLLHTERALTGVDTAFYLVHSMSPSARLAQGNFADMDLICADNFARAARTCGVRRIIYLGGLMPSYTDGLSMHLRSRLEVEKTLGAHDVPCTTLRAGLIIGAGGSSFRMMTRLVQRLPLMVMPAWTRSMTQPVALDDVIALLGYCVKHPEVTSGETFDIGCPTVLSYTDMLEQTARLAQRRLPMLHVPTIAPKLSLLWVSLVTGCSRQLVVPLVQSLRHDMVAQDALRLQTQAGFKAEDFPEAMARALAEEKQQATTRRQKKRPPKPKGPPVNSVISVQRLPLPRGRDAEWVADAYARWLPQFLRPFLRVDVQAGRKYRFFVPLLNISLLELTFAPHRSTPDRQLFYVTGGWLARLPQTEPGRFEFRSALDRSVCISAVHDFVPHLPWYIYKATQAVAHGWVMWAFGRYLARQKPVEVSVQSRGDTSAEALEKTQSTAGRQ